MIDDATRQKYLTICNGFGIEEGLSGCDPETSEC